ncbi:PDZ domain-containing protein, partial [Candidatus Sumerlaeota bacterium]|nr:PDZ domain-containing protein [Candidatus Sumerlaeota bacterium]
MGVLGYEPLESQLSDGCGAPPKRPIADLGAGVVESIAAGSPAERAGLRPGDRILSVNGEPIRDAIDLMFHASEHRLDLRYEPSGAKGANGKVPVRRLTIRREGWEELGVALRDFKIRMCNNQCVFCFIHQNPPGLRKGIYFKDGDYRMSFMHGNYVTTTNMKEEDFERIIGQRLTPMYVSVHTTNHELRLRMLGVKKSTNVLENLKRLKRGKIQFHTQI